MDTEGMSQAQAKAWSTALGFFEGKTFAPPDWAPRRYLSIPSAQQMLSELIRTERASAVSKPKVRALMAGINGDIDQILAKLRGLRVEGYFGYDDDILVGVLEITKTFFQQTLKASKDHDSAIMNATRELHPSKSGTSTRGRAGRPRNIEDPMLAYQCRFLLEGFGVKPTSGPVGNIAALAEAVHFLATGEKKCMEGAAALAYRDGKLADHIGMWRLRE